MPSSPRNLAHHRGAQHPNGSPKQHARVRALADRIAAPQMAGSGFVPPGMMALTTSSADRGLREKKRLQNLRYRQI